MQKQRHAPLSIVTRPTSFYVETNLSHLPLEQIGG